MGLMRILHELDSNFFAYKRARSGKTIGADVRPQHIRVPRNAGSPAESLWAWREFFNLLLRRDLPMLFVAPAGKLWLDICAGEPSLNEIYPLRVQSVGLASSVPYEIGPEIKSSCAELASQFETGHVVPSGQTEIIRKADPKPAAPSGTWDTSPAAKRFNWKILGAGGGGLILLLLVCVLWPGRGKHPTTLSPPQKVETNQPRCPRCLLRI